jgi:hypothetical protein
MWDAYKLLWSLLLWFFRSRASLEAENLILRQQVIVLRRTAPKRLSFNGLDRLIFVGLHRRLRRKPKPPDPSGRQQNSAIRKITINKPVGLFQTCGSGVAVLSGDGRFSRIVVSGAKASH